MRSRLAPRYFAPMAPSLVTVWLGKSFILRHLSNPPRDPAWTQFLEELRERAPERMLVSAEVGLSALQRTEMRDAMGRTPPSMAVLTTSVASLATLRILSVFMGQRIRGFHPSNASEAIAWLGVPVEDREKFSHHLAELLATKPSRMAS